MSCSNAAFLSPLNLQPRPHSRVLGKRHPSYHDQEILTQQLPSQQEHVSCLLLSTPHRKLFTHPLHTSQTHDAHIILGSTAIQQQHFKHNFLSHKHIMIQIPRTGGEQRDRRSRTSVTCSQPPRSSSGGKCRRLPSSSVAVAVFSVSLHLHTKSVSPSASAWDLGVEGDGGCQRC